MRVPVKALLYAVTLSLCFPAAARARETGGAATVRGTVLAAGTLAPVVGVSVYLLNTKVCKLQGAKMRVRTAHGDYLLPHYRRADYEAAADAGGAFALHGVAASPPFKSYTVYIRAAGYAPFVIHDARVYPDRTLTVRARLKKGAPLATWFEGTDAGAPIACGGGATSR